MNWRRGLLRFWIITSVIWVGAVEFTLRPDELARAYLLGPGPWFKPYSHETTFDEYMNSMDEFGHPQSVHDYAITVVERAAFYGFLPPIVVLAFWASIFWALNGFQRRPSN